MSLLNSYILSKEFNAQYSIGASFVAKIMRFIDLTWNKKMKAMIYATKQRNKIT